jgi:hypothetical protein
MRLTIKAKTIIWFLVISVCVYAFLILIFAYLYYATQSIGYYKFLAGGRDEIDFLRTIYFSVVSFHTIGYGDIYPINHQGRVIMMAQAFFSLFYTAVFSGLLVYFIIRRHSDIITTKHIYIRTHNNQWNLSIRIGNEGRYVIDFKGKFEAWLVEGNSRIRVFTNKRDMADLEYILYYDISLDDPLHKPLKDALMNALNGGQTLHMKFTFFGNDIQSGDQIAHSAYYDSSMIRFGKWFRNIYDWDEKGCRRNFQWRNFEKIEHLPEADIQEFLHPEST